MSPNRAERTDDERTRDREQRARRRAGLAESRQSAPAEGPAPANPVGPEGPTSSPSPRATRKPRRRARTWLLALAGVLALALVWFLIELFQPFHGSGEGRVVVVIPAGSGAGKVASILSEDGVISSSFFFELRATLEGKRGELRAGRFVLKRDMSYSAALAVLTKLPAPLKVVKITIPEGENRMQIAQLAAADGLRGSYLEASVRSKYLSPESYGAPSSTPNLEGFLFPATYEIEAGASASALAAEQLEAFKQDVGTEIRTRAHALHLSVYELLIVASMVEREALIPHDRPLIAAVIYNRLKDGMPLGIDSTIYYAVALQKHIPVWEHPLTEAQLHIDSPYNTRTHTGLPPTPISNPGLASIEAAERPAHVPYLYYVSAPDGCGEQRFSTSYAQFTENVAAYEAALAANHGHLPACRHHP